jgi:hypothetical protein
VRSARWPSSRCWRAWAWPARPTTCTP